MGQGNGTTTGPNGPINLPRFTWCSPFLWNIFSQMTQEDTRIFHKYIDYHLTIGKLHTEMKPYISEPPKHRRKSEDVNQAWGNTPEQTLVPGFGSSWSKIEARETWEGNQAGHDMDWTWQTWWKMWWNMWWKMMENDGKWGSLNRIHPLISPLPKEVWMSTNKEDLQLGCFSRSVSFPEFHSSSMHSK